MDSEHRWGTGGMKHNNKKAALPGNRCGPGQANSQTQLDAAPRYEIKDNKKTTRYSVANTTKHKALNQLQTRNYKKKKIESLQFACPPSCRDQLVVVVFFPLFSVEYLDLHTQNIFLYPILTCHTYTIIHYFNPFSSL